MRIVNKSNVPIEIKRDILNPGDSKFFQEWLPRNILNIHSRIASICVDTENGRRKFEIYGDLIAKESRKKEPDGTKVILVMNSKKRKGNI